jgi:signal transduction histidine kinase
VSTFPIVGGRRETERAARREGTSTDTVSSRGARTARNRALIGVGVVLFIVLLQAATQYLSGLDAARIRGHLGFLAIELPTIMVALGITSTYLKRRHASAGTAVGVTVLVAGTLGAGFGVLLYILSQHFPTVMLRPVANFTLARGAIYGFSFGQFHMGLWSLAFAYPFAIDEARVKDLEADQLRTAAELARLRAHLEPHFLLNTLNAIAGLVTEDPREARRLIGCLGDLLRDALHDDDELQTLHAQVAWLQRYAAILQARHAGALAFEWNIAPDTRGVLVPRLLLQPLIENAVKHGALGRAGGGNVALRVHFVGDMLVCAVEDDGPGAPPGEPRPGAFGLRAVVRRVELKYPGARVRLESAGDGPGTGTRALVEIPRAALGPSEDGTPPSSRRRAS